MADYEELPEDESWLKRRKTALILGAAGTSMAASVVFDPLDKLKDSLVQTAPWVAAGWGVGEIAWTGGAAIALSAVGSQVGRNPLRIRHKFGAMASHAKDSLLFKTGLAVNIAGAGAQVGVVTVGVLELPPRAWGLLAFPAYDLAITAFSRHALWQAIKNSSVNKQ